MSFFDLLIKLFSDRENDPSWYSDNHHPDIDRHRIHAHSCADAKLEVGECTPQECQEQKANWDKRHGY